MVPTMVDIEALVAGAVAAAVAAAVPGAVAAAIAPLAAQVTMLAAHAKNTPIRLHNRRQHTLRQLLHEFGPFHHLLKVCSLPVACCSVSLVLSC
jgi:hypothetical protein